MRTAIIKDTGYFEIEGDLIELAKEGKFDVIAHGCNCFCTMGSGIAPQMAKAFGCDKFDMEQPTEEGNVNKLGMIDFETFNIREDGVLIKKRPLYENLPELSVVNCYTQYDFRTRKDLDYEALTLCMRKMGFYFLGMHIGLPKIGAGLAGGDWERIKAIIQKELASVCKVTIVNYVKK